MGPFIVALADVILRPTEKCDNSFNVSILWCPNCIECHENGKTVLWLPFTVTSKHVRIVNYSATVGIVFLSKQFIASENATISAMGVNNPDLSSSIWLFPYMIISQGFVMPVNKSRLRNT